MSKRILPSASLPTIAPPDVAPQSFDDPAKAVDALTALYQRNTGFLTDAFASLADAARPRSALGFIVRGLQQRRAAGQPGLTLLSLDNLPSNGDTLRGLVQALAQQVDPALAAWIDAQCSFPNSMVDRIVPRGTDRDRADVSQHLGLDDAAPVLAEPFFDWAVEDHFVQGRPDWARAVPGPLQAGQPRFVTDAAPFERLKLRMVNGAHSAIAYLGVLAGWATVDEALRQPALRRFIDGLLRDEVAPTLTDLPGVDLDAYRHSLLTRFANPALAHRTQQIAMDGSQKLPQRWLASLQSRLAQGQPVPHLAMALAAWVHCLRGVDDAGRPYPIDDPMADTLTALARQGDGLAVLSHAPVFGALAVPSPNHATLVAAVAPALARLRAVGVAQALADFSP